MDEAEDTPVSSVQKEMALMDPADAARIANTVVRVCANGHSIVMYSARRDQPEPPCPQCGRVQVQTWPPQEDR